VLLSLLSLRGERARTRFYRSGARTEPSAFPPASVIVPVKGYDDGLTANLAALASLDYPDYELIVVSRSPHDLPPGAAPPRARIVFAGPPPDGTGEKVHNLLAAVSAARAETQVLAFADSDGIPSPGWLRALVAALETARAGAATGYRWHLPQPPVTGPALLRSVWNAVIAGSMGPAPAAFGWGGAMAIRRNTFSHLRIRDWWKGAVSDDYRLSEAVRAAGLHIVFTPGALVAATDGTTFTELLSWTTRQMRITRFYAPRLWHLSLAAHLIYCGAMVAGVSLLLEGSSLAAAALAVQLGTGYYKAARRLALASHAMPAHRQWFARYGWLHALLTPCGTWLWLYASAAAALSGTIQWRGYSLRLSRLSPPPVPAPPVPVSPAKPFPPPVDPAVDPG